MLMTKNYECTDSNIINKIQEALISIYCSLLSENEDFIIDALCHPIRNLRAVGIFVFLNVCDCSAVIARCDSRSAGFSCVPARQRTLKVEMFRFSTNIKAATSNFLSLLFSVYFFVIH